ncbi:MAG TPA: class I SAM-dependent rRNA methyltransferase [Burkholderiales bacterium]|nr:class I SAM-dependent rRNA methyltransferase [Burkholderiales bacterium]
MKSLHLKPGREKSVKRRHPWIFAGAVERVDGEPASGETVLVKAAGQPLALAAWSTRSQIRARVWSFDCSASVDEEFFSRRIRQAIALRDALPAAKHTNALRLVHGESDGLPGVIVDRYADVLVTQILSAGAERWREAILDALAEATGCEAVFERSDAEVRKLEGLEARTGFVRGNRQANRCPIVEHGLHFRVDVEQGQKTGFFLDQRENRQRVRGLAEGREVLDAFCYTGGFSLAALAGGARHVTAVESSAPALEVARENLAANSMDHSRVSLQQADVFAFQRQLRDEGRSFDLVVLDPPKFAPSAAQAKNAARAYKDINLLALKLLRPGGLLATFSCSGGVSAELFQSIVAGAAVDAGVDAKILGRFGAAADHPVALNFPEGDYLKGLLLVRAKEMK